MEQNPASKTLLPIVLLMAEKTYEETILTLHKALQESKIGRSEKIKALKRLRAFLT